MEAIIKWIINGIADIVVESKSLIETTISVALVSVGIWFAWNNVAPIYLIEFIPNKYCIISYWNMFNIMMLYILFNKYILNPVVGTIKQRY